MWETIWFLGSSSTNVFHGLGLSYRLTIKAMDLGRLCHLSPRWKNYAEISTMFEWGFYVIPTGSFSRFLPVWSAIFILQQVCKTIPGLQTFKFHCIGGYPRDGISPQNSRGVEVGRPRLRMELQRPGPAKHRCQALASALIPGWFVCGCAVLFGSDEKWKTCCFTMFQFYQNWNMQRVDREQVLSPLAELDGFAFCLSTATEEIYRMLESQNVKLYLVSQIFELFGKYWLFFINQRYRVKCYINITINIRT